MQVLGHAQSFLAPATTVQVCAVLLADHRRHAAIGVGGMKEMLKLLLATESADAHALLLGCWAKSFARPLPAPPPKAPEAGGADKPRRALNLLGHVDVRCVILAACMGMLERPAPLVPAEQVRGTPTAL